MLATDLELQLARPEAGARDSPSAVADRGAARRVAAELDAAGKAARTMTWR